MAVIPDGFSTLTPSLSVKGALEAIEFYQKALGATLVQKLMSDDGKRVIHACLQVGTSRLFLCDEAPEMGLPASCSSFYMLLEDVDAAVLRAKEAGMTEISPVQYMFWGDRAGSLKDRFGVFWTLATRQRDVTPDEIEEGRKSFMKKQNAAPAASGAERRSIKGSGSGD